MFVIQLCIFVCCRRTNLEIFQVCLASFPVANKPIDRLQKAFPWSFFYRKYPFQKLLQSKQGGQLIRETGDGPLSYKEGGRPSFLSWGRCEVPYFKMIREAFCLFKIKSKIVFSRTFHPLYSRTKIIQYLKIYKLDIGFLKKSVHETREVISCSSCPCQTDHNGENPKTWTWSGIWTTFGFVVRRSARWKLLIEFSYLGDARKLVQEWLGKSRKILQKSEFPRLKSKLFLNHDYNL